MHDCVLSFSSGMLCLAFDSGRKVENCFSLSLGGVGGGGSLSVTFSSLHHAEKGAYAAGVSKLLHVLCVLY